MEVAVVVALGLLAAGVAQRVSMVVVVAKATAVVAMETLKLEYGSLKVLEEVSTTKGVASHHTSRRPIQVLQTIPSGNGV